MNHPLLDRLVTGFGWPRIDTMEALDAFCARPGETCVFVPGDPAKNLETTDAAVIVPEIVAAFRGRFAVALVDDAIERQTRERFREFATPLLVFLRDGRVLGTIPRVRDWDEYLARVSGILDGAAVAAAE